MHKILIFGGRKPGAEYFMDARALRGLSAFMIGKTLKVASAICAWTALKLPLHSSSKASLLHRNEDLSPPSATCVNIKQIHSFVSHAPTISIPAPVAFTLLRESSRA
jgi:hypothetical protein